MCDFQKLIDRYYPADTSENRALRDIYMRHCRAVAELALKLAADNHLEIAPEVIRTAAMLHDIGIVMTDAPGIHCHGTERYLMHGPLGAEMIRKAGLPEKYARVARRHTGAGLTIAEMHALSIPVEDSREDMMPETTLERLICYADKFFSKSGDMKQKSLEQARRSISKFGEISALRFEKLQEEFGNPI